MNVLSLFDGISCGQVALERAGIKVDRYYASEIEKEAISITHKNFPNTISLGDITKLSEDRLLELPKIDLILAGSPCTGFSRNGTGLNFNHIQSKLFFEFVRILEWVKENNNEDVLFLLENVIMKKEWENVITESVKVDPININSSLVSAQKRDRLYWTNIKGVEQPKDKGIVLKDILKNDVDDGLYLTEEEMKSEPVELKSRIVERFISKEGENFVVRNATKLGYLTAEEGDSINLTIPKSKTRRGRVGKGKSNTLDTQCNQGVVDKGRVRRFTITELERLQTLPDNYTEGISFGKRKKAIGNGWTVDVIAHILSFMDKQ